MKLQVNGHYYWTPGKKIICIKEYEMFEKIKKGSVWTVSDSGEKTEEDPGWYIYLQDIANCFKYLERKTHLPRWF